MTNYEVKEILYDLKPVLIKLEQVQVHLGAYIIKSKCSSALNAAHRALGACRALEVLLRNTIHN